MISYLATLDKEAQPLLEELGIEFTPGPDGTVLARLSAPDYLDSDETADLYLIPGEFIIYLEECDA